VSRHAWLKLVPRDRFTEGKDVSLSQPYHALVKLMSSLAVVENVTAGKEVKLASSQSFHALVKFVPLLKFNAGNDSNEEQPRHAPEKLISSSASVLNVQAPKDVSAVQESHDDAKTVPRDKFNAGNEVNAVQSAHAPWKLISIEASVVNVQAPKEVMAVLVCHE